MAHSIPDAAAVVLETPGGRDRPHRRLQARPHAGGRPAHGRRHARRDRQPRRRPTARRLDERRAARASRESERVVGEAFRQIFPQPHGQDPRLVASPRTSTACSRRSTSASTAAARSRSSAARCARTRTSPATSATSNVPDERDPAPAGSRRAAAGRAADPLHRQPGRADVGDDADRVQRPSRREGRGRRHGDHLGEADPRATSCASTTRSTGWRDRARRCCTRTTRRCTSPGHGRAEELRTHPRPRCARSAVMPVHGEFRMLAAHAQLAREGGVPGRSDRDRGERRRSSSSPTGSARIVDHVAAGMTFVDGLGVGDVHDVALRDRRRLAEDGVADRRRDARGVERRELAHRAAGADRARLRGSGRAAARRAARTRPAASSTTCSTTTSPRSSCCRSTCTTRSAKHRLRPHAAGGR